MNKTYLLAAVLLVGFTAAFPSVLRADSITTSTDTFTATIDQNDYPRDGQTTIVTDRAHDLVVNGTNWTLYARPKQSTFTYNGNFLDPNKPESDLEDKLDQQSTSDYTVLNSSDSAVIATGADSETVSVDYRLTSDLASDVPGFYTLTIDFILETN